MDRRKFILSGSRWVLAGSLLATTGLLIYRRKVGDPNDCFVNPYCKRCSENRSCAIVAATMPEKNEKQKRQNGK